MSKLMVKVDDIWVPMEGLKGDTGPLPADETIPDTALVTDGAKTNTAYLMHNRLTKDAEGELISVDDSYPSAALSLTVDGKSTQVTTTGKNLLDYNYMFDTPATTSGDYWNYYVISIPAGTYTMSCNQGTAGAAPYGFALTGGDTPESTWQCYNRHPVTVTVAEGQSVTLCKRNRSGYVPTKALHQNGTLTLQLEAGSSATAYEPYTGGKPSPRPDWPQDIESVEQSDLYLIPNEGLYLEQGGLHTDGRNTTANFNIRVRSHGYMPVSKDEELTIDTGAISYRASFSYYETNENNPARIGYESFSQTPVTFLVPSGANYARILLAGYPNDSHITINNFAGLTIKSSIHGTYAFGLAHLLPEGTSLRSLPDGTKDELHLTYIRPSTREGWAYYRGEKIKRVGKLILDGSQIFTRGSGTSNRMYLPLNTMARSSDYTNEILSERFVAKKRYDNIGFSENGEGVSGWAAGSDYPGKNWLYLYVHGITTAGAMKTWFFENPTLFQYHLATPETIDLGIFELPVMQSGTTHLWSDPSTNLSVTYERDRNIVITNLKAAVADLATS